MKYEYNFLVNGKWYTFESEKKLSKLEEKIAEVQINGCILYTPAIGRMGDVDQTPYIQTIPEKYRKIFPCNTCMNAGKFSNGWSICRKPTPIPLKERLEKGMGRVSYPIVEGHIPEYPLNQLLVKSKGDQ